MTGPLASGTILRSRYKIIELVGGGGMGAVYKAEDLRLEGRLCAIKEVRLDSSAGQSAKAQMSEQFYREASILARLDHPNLPKVSDYFTEKGREYLVMDFVPGKDLGQVLREAQAHGSFLPEEQVLKWAGQLCDALEYLHSQDPPVLHRDIKPDNARLTPGNTVKLVDFGLVKLMAPDDNQTITILQGLGTVQYTPLEQYGGDTGHTDPRSDIYSLGATIYHLLTGRPPVNAKQRFLHPGSMPRPREINPAISLRTEQAILHAMEMHPDRRPASIADFRRELLYGVPPSSSRYLAVEKEVERRASLRILIFPALLVGLLLALAIYVTATGPLTLSLPW